MIALPGHFSRHLDLPSFHQWHHRFEDVQPSG
ncbi:Uncharacterised protein [Vibrio cholerae]|nr:Uncharacterised protein [Vibrio cholerae]